MLRTSRPVVANWGSNEHDSIGLGHGQLPLPPQAQDSPASFTNRHGVQDLANGDTQMSPHSVGNFVQDLVEMAKATEMLPVAQERIRELEAELARKSDHITALEVRAHQRNMEIDGLHSQIKSAEVARDDAELRFLESEDRCEKALAFIRVTFGNAGALIQALEPEQPKAEPQAQPVEVPAQSGERATDPTVNSLSGSELPSATSQDAEKKEDASLRTTDNPTTTGTPNVDSQTTIEGQGVADPTVPVHTESGPAFASSAKTTTQESVSTSNPLSGQSDPPPTPALASPEPANSTIATSQDGASLPEQQPDGPYAGKLYYNHPVYVPRMSWKEGGGTDESYDWRPDRSA